MGHQLKRKLTSSTPEVRSVSRMIPTEIARVRSITLLPLQNLGLMDLMNATQSGL